MYRRAAAGKSANRRAFDTSTPQPGSVSYTGVQRSSWYASAGNSAVRRPSISYAVQTEISFTTLSTSSSITAMSSAPARAAV